MPRSRSTKFTANRKATRRPPLCPKAPAPGTLWDRCSAARAQTRICEQPTFRCLLAPTCRHFAIGSYPLRNAAKAPAVQRVAGAMIWYSQLPMRCLPSFTLAALISSDLVGIAIRVLSAIGSIEGMGRIFVIGAYRGCPGDVVRHSAVSSSPRPPVPWRRMTL